MAVEAILWDYDGTLVDSTRKNMAVTMEVLRHFDPDIVNHPPEALTCAASYQKANFLYKNWKELYQKAYGLGGKQLEEAGALWSPYQRKDKTIPELFTGLDDLIHSLKTVKMGICSQNCAVNIEETLKHYGIADYFSAIIGYEDISFEEQKPSPAGFVKCLDRLEIPLENAAVIYIGDHAEDVVFGKNAMAYYQAGGKNLQVISIAAEYSENRSSHFKTRPDYAAKTVEELGKIIRAVL